MTDEFVCSIGTLNAENEASALRTICDLMLGIYLVDSICSSRKSRIQQVGIRLY